MNPQVHRSLAGGAAFAARFMEDMDPGRILLVCRPDSFRRSGAQSWFAQTALASSPAFADFSSNPKEVDVSAGIARFREIGATGIVAVGGGSVLDMAKLINYFGSMGIVLDDYQKSPPSGTTALRPLLAVPTTAGSGSEATHFAVVYRGHEKYSVADPRIRPSHVLLAPEFTWSMDAYQTACCGMDALAQSIESSWALAATDESREYAREARTLAFHNLASAVNTPNPENRAAMLEAAHLAGKAINLSKTTGAHAFSYVLTSEFGLPHGHAVGLLLPYFIRYHAQAGISINGIGEPSIRNIIQEIGLNRNIPVTAMDLFAMFKQHVNLDRLANNPVPVTREFVMQMASGLSAG